MLVYISHLHNVLFGLPVRTHICTPYQTIVVYMCLARAQVFQFIYSLAVVRSQRWGARAHVNSGCGSNDNTSLYRLSSSWSWYINLISGTVIMVYVIFKRKKPLHRHEYGAPFEGIAFFVSLLECFLLLSHNKTLAALNQIGSMPRTIANANVRAF